MSIEVKPVTNSSEMMQFIKMQWKIYENDPAWVPPLIMDRKKFFSDKNPFFRKNPTQMFLAFKNGEIVGRIGAIVNKSHNEYHNDNSGFFGFFEAIDDVNVTKALIETAEKWVREKGFDKIIGPMNPSTNDDVGFLSEGFDTPPFMMMPHTHEYYVSHFRQLGYNQEKELYAYLITYEMLTNNPKLERVAKLIAKKYPVKIRKVNMKNFRAELEVVREIYNDAWAPNWGFVPLEGEDFDYVANDFKQIIDPRVTYIGEFEGEAIGFFLALPDYNQVFKKIGNGKLFPFGIFKFLMNKSKIDRIRVITLGIKQKYQPLGIGALFYNEIIKNAAPAGYRSAEMSWVLEDNDLMNKSAKLLGGEIHKRYLIFSKDL